MHPTKVSIVAAVGVTMARGVHISLEFCFGSRVGSDAASDAPRFSTLCLCCELSELVISVSAAVNRARFTKYLLFFMVVRLSLRHYPSGVSRFLVPRNLGGRTRERSKSYPPRLRNEAGTGAAPSSEWMPGAWPGQRGSGRGRHRPGDESTGQPATSASSTSHSQEPFLLLESAPGYLSPWAAR